MRTDPPPWPGAPLPTDVKLLAALRDGGRMPRLLEGLPHALLVDQFRRAGAQLPEKPGKRALKAQLPVVREYVEQAHGAQALLTTWSAVFLPAFLAAPGEADIAPWRGALLCRVGALTLGEPTPPLALLKAADDVIAGRIKVLQRTHVRAWGRWFGLRDVATQAEGLARRVERTLADVRRQVEDLSAGGGDPLADWQRFADGMATVLHRKEGLERAVESTLSRLVAQCERLDLRPPEPVDLAVVTELAHQALEDLGPTPTPPPAVPLTLLVERMDPAPAARDRLVLQSEIEAAETEGPSPLLDALIRVLVEDRAPHTDEQLLFEEHLSGRFCRQLAAGTVSLRDTPRIEGQAPTDERRLPLGDGRPSPFTVGQQHLLRGEGFGVVLVVGSPALGLGRAWPALQALHADAERERCWQIGAQGGAHLTIDPIREARRRHPDQGLRPVVQRAGMPVAEYLLAIQLAVDWLRHADRSGGFVQITFILDPLALFAARRDGVMGRLETQTDVTLVRLRRWRGSGLQARDGQIESDVKHILKRTGGWPALVDFIDDNGLTARWPAGTIGDLGLEVHPDAAEVLRAVEGGALDQEQLEAALTRDGLRPRHARALIAYARDLDLLTGPREALSAEPVAAASLPDRSTI